MYIKFAFPCIDHIIFAEGFEFDRKWHQAAKELLCRSCHA